MDHFGSLWDHFCRMKMTLEPLSGHFGITFGEGDFGITLGSLFVSDDDFVATLGSLCGQFSHLRAALGILWGHFGGICGIWG